MARKAPHIRTRLPGPKARKVIKLDERYTSPSYTRGYPLVIARGRGVTVEDPDGNLFLDFTAGIAVTAAGHCHPKVVNAIKKQAGKFLHMSGTDFYYGPQSRLAERLARLVPGRSKRRVQFTNSGAESIEAAFKLARYNTGRARVIAFLGAFHGRTFGAMSLTGSKAIQRAHFAPLVPEVHHVAYAYCYRCPYNLTWPECDFHCVKYIEDVLFARTVPPEEVAAIFVEPIQGEGGYVVPPPGYHQRLRKLCNKYGILYVADEVQSGIGRTGKMFALEHWTGVEPDVVCVAKGLASGMPIGAMIAKESVMTWKGGSHASTFGGNPVSCAAALTTLELVEKKLAANAARVGRHLVERLQYLAGRHPAIGDVRGLGLMCGVELVTDRKSKRPAKKLRDRLVQACFAEGLLILGCGENTVRFCPGLVVTRAEVDAAMDIVDRVLARLTRRGRK